MVDTCNNELRVEQESGRCRRMNYDKVFSIHKDSLLFVSCHCGIAFDNEPKGEVLL
jgi:hypothetical protein